MWGRVVSMVIVPRERSRYPPSEDVFGPRAPAATLSGRIRGRGTGRRVHEHAGSAARGPDDADLRAGGGGGAAAGTVPARAARQVRAAHTRSDLGVGYRVFGEAHRCA